MKINTYFWCPNQNLCFVPAVCLTSPRTKRSSIKLVSLKQKNTRSPLDVFNFDLVIRADRRLQFSPFPPTSSEPLQETLAAGHQTSPSASIWARLVLHLSQDCCVCVYICSDTKSSWKYTQQEDTTITVMPVYFSVFNVLQRTVAERSVEAVSPAPHWMSHVPPSSSVKLHVWGLDDTNTCRNSCFPGGLLWLIWGNLAWLKKKKKMFTILQKHPQFD